jgi:hypothetical protein
MLADERMSIDLLNLPPLPSTALHRQNWYSRFGAEVVRGLDQRDVVVFGVGLHENMNATSGRCCCQC